MCKVEYSVHVNKHLLLFGLLAIDGNRESHLELSYCIHNTYMGTENTTITKKNARKFFLVACSEHISMQKCVYFFIHL